MAGLSTQLLTVLLTTTLALGSYAEPTILYKFSGQPCAIVKRVSNGAVVEQKRMCGWQDSLSLSPVNGVYQITVDYNVQRNANGEEIPKFAQSYTWTKNYGLVFLDAKNCLRGAESPYRIVGFNRNEIIGPCPAPPYKKSQGNEIEGLIADGGEDLFAPASTLDFDSYLGSGTLSTPNENLDLTSPLIADSTVFGNFLPGPGDAGTTNEEFSIFNTAENPENLSPFSNAAVNDDMFSGTDPLNIGYEPLAKRGSGKQGRQREHN